MRTSIYRYAHPHPPTPPRYLRSKELYLEAIGVEADCVEAIFNLGLANKRLARLEMDDPRYVDEGIQAFEKLHQLVPNSPEVLFQIAAMLEIKAEQEQMKVQEGYEDAEIAMQQYIEQAASKYSM